MAILFVHRYGSGRWFEELERRLKVHEATVLCDIVSVVFAQIKCRTDPCTFDQLTDQLPMLIQGVIHDIGDAGKGDNRDFYDVTTINLDRIVGEVDAREAIYAVLELTKSEIEPPLRERLKRDLPQIFDHTMEK